MTSPSSIFFIDEAKVRVTKVPCLLVFGKEDTAINYRMVPECAEHVTDFQYEIIEGASHWVQFYAPDRVNKAIAKFIKQRNRARL